MRLIRKFSWLCASSHPFECSSFLHPPLTTMTTFIPFLCKSFLHPPLTTMTTVIPFLCKSFLHPPLITMTTFIIAFAHLGSALIFFLCWMQIFTSAPTQNNDDIYMIYCRLVLPWLCASSPLAGWRYPPCFCWRGWPDSPRSGTPRWPPKTPAAGSKQKKNQLSLSCKQRQNWNFELIFFYWFI